MIFNCDIIKNTLFSFIPERIIRYNTFHNIFSSMRTEILIELLNKKSQKLFQTILFEFLFSFEKNLNFEYISDTL